MAVNGTAKSFQFNTMHVITEAGLDILSKRIHFVILPLMMTGQSLGWVTTTLEKMSQVTIKQ